MARGARDEPRACLVVYSTTKRHRDTVLHANSDNRAYDPLITRRPHHRHCRLPSCVQ